MRGTMRYCHGLFEPLLIYDAAIDGCEDLYIFDLNTNKWREVLDWDVKGKRLDRYDSACVAGDIWSEYSVWARLNHSGLQHNIPPRILTTFPTEVITSIITKLAPGLVHNNMAYIHSFDSFVVMFHT